MTERTLIDAAVLCRKQNARKLKVLLAGNGPMEAALRERMAGIHHAEGFIRLLGYRTDLERVVPRVADVIVSCSHREGLGLNLIEGMLCGKP